MYSSPLIAGLGIVCAVALTACTRFVAQPLDPAASLAALDARRLDAPALIAQLRQDYPQRPWPPAQWDLESLTLVAAEIHPDLAAARAERDLAEAGLISAGARPNPTLNLSGQYNNRPLEGENPWSRGVGLDFLLETAGKRDARLRFATQHVAAARAHWAGVRWQQRVRIADALLAVAEARQIGALLQEAQTLAAEASQAVAQRVATGYTARPEQLAADSHTLDLLQQRTAVAQTEREALGALAGAVGLTEAALKNVSLTLPVPVDTPLPSASTLIAQALHQRADIQAALADYAAAEARLAGEIAKQYPDLSLAPGYLWDAGAVKWSLGLGFALPVFQHNQGPIAEAEAGRQLARARFEALQLAQRTAIEQAAAREATTRQALAVATATSQLAEQQRRATEAAFTVGAADRLQRIASRDAELTARRILVGRTFEQARALVALEDAVQQPLRPEPETLSP